MKYEPHDYQVYASEYIKEHDAAAVFLECGLGKTSITLTAICDLLFDSFEIHRVLVIAPIRVAKMSWPDEIKKWDHTSDLRYSVAVGTEAERMEALEARADIYLINRENVQWLVEKSGLPFDYDMVVVDELSSFKNWQAKRFKALKISQIVENLLHFSGIEQKEHPCEALFLDEVLSQCIEEQEVLFEQRNLEIKKSIQPNLAVQGNPELLGELFSNLLSNAVKYASAESVTVELARQEQSCVFRITNQTMQNWIPIRSGCYSM